MTSRGDRVAGTGPLERVERDGKVLYTRGGVLVAVRVLVRGRELDPLHVLEHKAAEPPALVKQRHARRRRLA